MQLSNFKPYQVRKIGNGFHLFQRLTAQGQWLRYDSVTYKTEQAAKNAVLGFVVRTRAMQSQCIRNWSSK